MSYDVVDVDPPAREFNDFDDEDVVSEWVNPLHVIRDTAGTRACAGFLCTWELHKEITTPAPQVSGPIEHDYLGKNILTSLYKLFFIKGVNQVTQGLPIEQNTEPISDANLYTLTGVRGALTPPSTNPTTPSKEPAWWTIATIVVLFLGVAGVARVCFKG